MNVYYISETQVKKLTNQELTLEWGNCKAANNEINCEYALRILTEEMKKRKLI